MSACASARAHPSLPDATSVAQAQLQGAAAGVPHLVTPFPSNLQFPFNMLPEPQKSAAVVMCRGRRLHPRFFKREALISTTRKSPSSSSSAAAAVMWNSCRQLGGREKRHSRLLLTSTAAEAAAMAIAHDPHPLLLVLSAAQQCNLPLLRLHFHATK